MRTNKLKAIVSMILTAVMALSCVPAVTMRLLKMRRLIIRRQSSLCIPMKI